MSRHPSARAAWTGRSDPPPSRRIPTAARMPVVAISHREVGARRRLWRGADLSAIFGVLASGGDGMGESGSGRSAARCPVGLEDKVGDAGPSESSVSSRGGTLLQSFPDHLVRQDLDDRLRQGIGVAGRNE